MTDDSSLLFNDYWFANYCLINSGDAWTGLRFIDYG